MAYCAHFGMVIFTLSSVARRATPDAKFVFTMNSELSANASELVSTLNRNFPPRVHVAPSHLRRLVLHCSDGGVQG